MQHRLSSKSEIPACGRQANIIMPEADPPLAENFKQIQIFKTQIF
jgi:hypothetical protein